MMKIEKAVKIVSDLYEFYRKIPKVSNSNPVSDERHNQQNAADPSVRGASKSSRENGESAGR